MSAAIQDILIGIVSSIIVGVAVWSWGRIRRSRNLNRKSQFFGIAPGDKCLLVMNRTPRYPNAMNHGDAGALVEAAGLVREIRGEVTVAPFDEAIEPAGGMTEFCIGGPDSNERTRTHLDNFLKGVSMNPYANETDPLAITTKTEKFKYEKGTQEYAVLAKFRPNPNARPVFLVCGQTPIANRGAMYYLAQNYDSSLRRKFGLGPFCLILKLTSHWTYGHKMVALVKDVTDTAFVE